MAVPYQRWQWQHPSHHTVDVPQEISVHQSPSWASDFQQTWNYQYSVALKTCPQTLALPALFLPLSYSSLSHSQVLEKLSERCLFAPSTSFLHRSLIVQDGHTRFAPKACSWLSLALLTKKANSNYYRLLILLQFVHFLCTHQHAKGFLRDRCSLPCHCFSGLWLVEDWKDKPLHAQSHCNQPEQPEMLKKYLVDWERCTYAFLLQGR